MNSTADIGASSRELKSEEKGLVETVIAQDGIAIVVNKANSVHNIPEPNVPRFAFFPVNHASYCWIRPAVLRCSHRKFQLC
jgi:hypothetical protein